MRLFHKALNSDPSQPFTTDGLVRHSSQCTSIPLFREVMGKSPEAKTYEDILRLRVPFQEALSNARSGSAVFLKTHSHNLEIDGIEPFHKPAIALAIVIIRNPFDVVASRFNHFLEDREHTINEFNGPNAWGDPTDRNNVPVMISSWKRNVFSWICDDAIPKVILRYEDLLRDDGSLWRQIAQNIFGATSEAQIEFAIEATRFQSLQRQEEQHGFEEKPAHVGRFFNRGEIGYGLEILTRREKKIIWRENKLLAERLGYSFEGGALKVRPMKLDGICDLSASILGKS